MGMSALEFGNASGDAMEVSDFPQWLAESRPYCIELNAISDVRL